MELARLSTLLLCSVSVVIGTTSAVEPTDKPAPSTSPQKTVRVLTIGASLTNNATEYLAKLAEADGNRFVQGRAIVAGSSMASHWAMVEKHEANPLDPAGLYLTKQSLQQMFAAQPWDFVTYQQSSSTGHDVTSFRPYAQSLYDLIRREAPQSKIYLYHPPTYRSDHPRFAKSSLPEPNTQAEMFEQTSQAYRTIAAELGVELIPVAAAFFAADTDPDWGYQVDTKFDPKTAQSPELPNQAHSLHVGWFWKKNPTTDELKLQFDPLHAGVAGKYLAACAFYETLFGTSVVGNAFLPEGLSVADAHYLQAVAHRTVAAERERSKTGR